ncbi:HNH endonuclease [Vibrio diabolicus]|uniref:HNH endonuclease n=1 Tax=Vibrio diabolicus TaxID=50719 RepID=UPI00215F32B9|nr:HNH endonuclease [Vibrio diabolicus]MCS0307303.1 HNH endonuclease [Vibrio diabolicus]MCS0408127.1 HNH endonuclease [Vibrio diabolicus]
MPNVNLDALISREDFEVIETNSRASSFNQNVSVKDLERGEFFYAGLRKPDFQRETSDWTDDQLCEFIQSFIDGDLIPAVILWNSGPYNFVIDGAHRLGALIAWINDDYGDGAISKQFFNDEIDEEQRDIANKTREKIKNTVKSYSEYKKATADSKNTDREMLEKALSLGRTSIQLQWVSGGAEKAEQSFFKINQKASKINDTEIELLQSRRKAFAIASRAIMRAGAGHQYWSKFEPSVMTEIEDIAKEINGLIFQPKISGAIRTLDLPLVKKYNSPQTNSFIFDLVKKCNGVPNNTKKIDDDSDGKLTVTYLKNTRKFLRRINSSHPSSLGLHPLVYFYNKRGNHIYSAILAWVDIVKEIEKSPQSLKSFCFIRNDLEKFLIKYKHFISGINAKYGSGTKSYKHIIKVTTLIISLLQKQESENTIVDMILGEYKFLAKDDDVNVKSLRFSTDVKSQIYIQETLPKSSTCSYCNGFIHQNSISFDHVLRKQDGGKGSVQNGALMHPYCNTSAKN